MKKTKQYKPRKSGAKKFKRKDPERERRQKMYQTSDWKSFRYRFMAMNKKCFCCGESATVVDHRVPHKGDQSLFEDELNFLPMCEFCHNRVNVFDRNSDNVGKMTWVKKMRLERNLTFGIKVVRYRKE